jgi:hypothetical protein
MPPRKGARAAPEYAAASGPGCLLGCREGRRGLTSPNAIPQLGLAKARLHEKKGAHRSERPIINQPLTLSYIVLSPPSGGIFPSSRHRFPPRNRRSPEFRTPVAGASLCANRIVCHDNGARTTELRQPALTHKLPHYLQVTLDLRGAGRTPRRLEEGSDIHQPFARVVK